MLFRSAAMLLEEKDIANGGIVPKLDRLYNDRGQLEKMSQKVRAFASDEVEKEIFENVNKLLKSYKKILK